MLTPWRQACIIFFDEVDAIGGTRFDDGAGGDNEVRRRPTRGGPGCGHAHAHARALIFQVQRTMLEIVNQLDGFDARGNIKVRGRAVCACMRACVMCSLAGGGRFSWRRTVPIRWTPHCFARAGWTARYGQRASHFLCTRVRV